MRLHKISIKFSKGSKLSPQFIGLFEIIERLRSVAYRLVLPSSLSRMHDVFDVSVLCHYVLKPSHVVDLINLQISDEGALLAEPVHILDR